MITIGIIDDEEIWLNKIKDILITNFDDIEIYTSNSVKHMNYNVDFILLDIDMPDEDGIKFSKKHRDIKIIFVTNYDNRVKEAIGPNVYSYVSKQNLTEELINATAEIIKSLNNNYIVPFKLNSMDINIKIDDIIYCQYIGGRRIAVIYKNKQIIVKNMHFKDIISYLDDRFLKINRDIIINKHKMIKIDSKYVYLKGVNSKFEISRRQRKNIQKHYYGDYDE